MNELPLSLSLFRWIWLFGYWNGSLWNNCGYRFFRSIKAVFFLYLFLQIWLTKKIVNELSFWLLSFHKHKHTQCTDTYTQKNRSTVHISYFYGKQIKGYNNKIQPFIGGRIEWHNRSSKQIAAVHWIIMGFSSGILMKMNELKLNLHTHTPNMSLIRGKKTNLI